ncbi:MAG: cytochrome bd ubiquinol oxidase subunit [Solirubrobacteraceae bacterium]|nr:cytochrome bd ubiquinol oxidase subunit [Solirubrobacteraceae bacterium]
MQLSDGWMIFVLLAFTMYIVLDGYDLGIGVLTLFERDARRRRDMLALVAWTWDGNESWIALLALTLWAGLPLVVGIALPALYIVLIPMLWALIARGVSLELIDEQDGWHPLWGKVFGIGSLVAGFCQGAAFGGLVAGLDVRGVAFAGGPFAFLHHGYAVLTGLTAVALYVLAGAAWVYLKSEGETQPRAARAGRIAVAVLIAGTAASWLLAPVAGPVRLDPGAAARLPVWIAGAAVLAAGSVFAVRSFSSHPRGGRRSDRAPVLATLAVYAGGLLLAGGLLYPNLVPPAVTVHEAASPHATLLFLTIATGVLIPIILTYQAYAYWVFRGKVDVEQEATTA